MHSRCSPCLRGDKAAENNFTTETRRTPRTPWHVKLGHYLFFQTMLSEKIDLVIKRLDPANGNAVSAFATGVSSPVDLKVSTDGGLYYLARGAGAVGKIEYPGTVDSIPPMVSITNPAQGSFVARKATIILSATASDNVGVARVEFYVNGGLQCSDSSAGYTCNWKVPNPPNRTYQIEARAFDQAGNSGSALVQVTSR